MAQKKKYQYHLSNEKNQPTSKGLQAPYEEFLSTGGTTILYVSNETGACMELLKQNKHVKPMVASVLWIIGDSA